MTDKIKLVKCLFLWVFAPHWLAPHQLQFLHTESPSMPVCWPPFVKVQPMYWISCPLFFTLSGEFHFYYYYYCSPVYDSSFIACAILFLLAQGCRNDIMKPSCLLSCDRSSPSTGLAGVSCRTKDNRVWREQRKHRRWPISGRWRPSPRKQFCRWWCTFELSRTRFHGKADGASHLIILHILHELVCPWNIVQIWRLNRKRAEKKSGAWYLHCCNNGH